MQQRIGALALIWGMFETNLETTLWALRGEKVAGVRPSTDKTTISLWIDNLAQNLGKLSPPAQKVISEAAIAAKDLMEYRHAVIHGWLIPSPTTPHFIRNPSWHGERRNRPSSDAHVDENLLDMAIDSAWVLYRAIILARAACTNPEAAQTLAGMKPDIARARSQSGELRHLTALMNHEKY